MVILLLIFGCLLGLVLGSFANVLIHRLPRRESIVHPGSRCPRCGTPIRWHQNVPLLSYLLLGGRCASCKAPISPRYPLVELAMGVLFALCAWRWDLHVETLAAWLFILLCLPLAVIDLEHQLLPDRLTYPGILLGLALSPFLSWTSLPQSLMGAVLGAGLPALLIGAYALFGIEAMGWGDVKFMAFVGAFLGWKGALLTLLLGALLGSLIGGAYLLATGRGRRTPLPFGTFLAAAALFSLFEAQGLWAWYGRMLQPGAGP
jgi:leader peptidase (prepilin peptidase)/N-methyltransferase